MNTMNYIINDTSAIVINISTGSSIIVKNTDERYARFVYLIKENQMDTIEEEFSLAQKVSKFFATHSSMKLNIVDGVGRYDFTSSGNKGVLHDVLVDRILKMEEAGFDCHPIVNFISNTLLNPSKQSVEELYLFIEQSALPLTPDGCFIAYKIVTENYLDIYTKSIENKVGYFCEVPRNIVDPDRNMTCGTGLHFCSKEYLPSYGSSVRATDRCMLVKINPMDVVSITKDYNNAKGRTCRYEVVGELKGGWRNDDDYLLKDELVMNVQNVQSVGAVENVSGNKVSSNDALNNQDTTDFWTEDDDLMYAMDEFFETVEGNVVADDEGIIMSKGDVIRTLVDYDKTFTVKELEAFFSRHGFVFMEEKVEVDTETDTKTYYFCDKMNRWRESVTGKVVSAKTAGH